MAMPLNESSKYWSTIFCLSDRQLIPTRRCEIDGVHIGMHAFVVQEADPRWDAYVLGHPGGTFFHQWKWREVIATSFGYQPVYLCAEENGEIRGILPLFLVRSLLFGRSLVAVPLAVYGGVLASTAAAETILLEKAIALGTQHGAKYLELRGNPHVPPVLSTNGADGRPSAGQKDLYVTFLGEIDPDHEVNLSRIPRKQRRMVRQGEKHGLRFSCDKSRLREFYQVYASSVRNLGTPVFGYPYFENIVETFGDQCEVFLVDFQDKAVAAVLVFFYKDQVLPYYGGALREYFHLAPSDFMYWELMKYGAGEGFKTFDFGRSKKGTGSFDFKRHWGFEPRPLPYFYHQIKDSAIPDTSSLNPKLQWAVRIWRNLPLKLTMVLGPRIVRHSIP
jgi:FemAB-related protein (PEP-CTERM system-associated)